MADRMHVYMIVHAAVHRHPQTLPHTITLTKVRGHRMEEGVRADGVPACAWVCERVCALCMPACASIRARVLQPTPSATPISTHSHHI